MSKIVLNGVRGVPLNKLHLSQANVRRIKAALASSSWPRTLPDAGSSSRSRSGLFSTARGRRPAWDALARSHSREPYAIRRLLTEHAVKASDKRAVFVGAEGYEAAGGSVARGLFQQDGGGWFDDPAHRLVRVVAHQQTLRGTGRPSKPASP